MKISDLHIKVDETLKEMGFEKDVNIQWGSLTIQVDFQAGKEVLTIRERTTKKQ